ncbi:MAG: S-methyl-5-thioribose-1-phosphate isomerase [Halioglobus sp.]
MFSSDDLSSLRLNTQSNLIEIIDQTLLPHQLQWRSLESLGAYCHAIEAMQVRGAPLIGITAACGLAFAITEDPSEANIDSAAAQLLATRPTAVNLRWALDQVLAAVANRDEQERATAAWERAYAIRDEDIANCSRIGDCGLLQLQELVAASKGETLNIMTHCNAGWLATIQWGTALAPIYKAHAAGLPVHVWVSETRPRSQGMNLTAWELQRAGVPCTVVADNSCGHLMQQGLVDCVIVGTDRTAANGDVCNKIGTYLKALAANANAVPFFVGLPASTVDWLCPDGTQIPIEERSAEEVLQIGGVATDGAYTTIQLAAAGTKAANPAFDTTPAALVTSLLTEYGAFAATPEGMAALREQLPEHLA